MDSGSKIWSLLLHFKYWVTTLTAGAACFAVDCFVADYFDSSAGLAVLVAGAALCDSTCFVCSSDSLEASAALAAAALAALVSAAF